MYKFYFQPNRCQSVPWSTLSGSSKNMIDVANSFVMMRESGMLGNKSLAISSSGTYDYVGLIYDHKNYASELYASSLNEIEKRSIKILNDYKELGLASCKELKKKSILPCLEV